MPSDDAVNFGYTEHEEKALGLLFTGVLAHTMDEPLIGLTRAYLDGQEVSVVVATVSSEDGSTAVMPIAALLFAPTGWSPVLLPRTDVPVLYPTVDHWTEPSETTKERSDE